MREISELIAGAQSFLQRQTQPMQSELLRENKSTLVSRYDEETGKSDYYNLITKELKRSAFEAVSEIPSMNSTEVLWPGNLLQGKSVQSGNLAAIPVANKRTAGNIALNVVSGQEGMQYFKTVTKISGVGVTQAMHDVLAPYTGGFPADVSYVHYCVSSEEEMAYYMDMRPEEFTTKSKGVFNPVNWSNGTNKIMVKLRQVFFTMSYDYHGPQSVFTNDIEYKDLSPYISKDNPPCYVSSVSYGRYFILLYESNYSELHLSAALRKAYGSDQKDVFTNEEKNIIKKANVLFVQVGGDPESGLETITGDPEKIRQFIVKGAKFSINNVGAPIGYKICYMHDATPFVAYKKLDVTNEILVYEPEKKLNNVTIEIKDLFIRALSLSGGNLTLSNKSSVTVGNIAINVYNKDGSLYKALTPLNPGIQEWGTKGNDLYRTFNHVVSTGELGVNTDKRVVIEFNVSFNNVRYGGGVDAPIKDYAKRIEYVFDDKTQLWVINSKDLFQDNSFT